jgi:XTP/dITP diphosphohydrolase
MAQVKARLASGNAHKLEELRAALPGWELAPVEADVEETGGTYEDNARLKARAGRDAADADELVLGEDSGIEVDALAGGPGVQSARWAPAGSQAEALLERLGDEPNRRARMVATIVALSSDGEEVTVVGVLPGEVARERRGTGGFGYDPVFVPDGFEQTVAELGNEWKRTNSHRARAAHALRDAVSPSRLDG